MLSFKGLTVTGGSASYKVCSADVGRIHQFFAMHFSMVLLRGPPAMAAGFHREQVIYEGKGYIAMSTITLPLEIVHCYFSISLQFHKSAPGYYGRKAENCVNNLK